MNSRPGVAISPLGSSLTQIYSFQLDSTLCPTRAGAGERTESRASRRLLQPPSTSARFFARVRVVSGGFGVALGCFGFCPLLFFFFFFFPRFPPPKKKTFWDDVGLEGAKYSRGGPISGRRGGGGGGGTGRPQEEPPGRAGWERCGCAAPFPSSRRGARFVSALRSFPSYFFLLPFIFSSSCLGSARAGRKRLDSLCVRRAQGMLGTSRLFSLQATVCVCFGHGHHPGLRSSRGVQAGPSPLPQHHSGGFYLCQLRNLSLSSRSREKQHVPILPAQALLRNAGFGGGMMTTQTCPDPRHSVVWGQHPIPMPAHGSKPSCHPTEICRSGERSPGDMPSIGRAGPTALPALGTGQLAGREMNPLAPPGHEVHAQLSPGEWPQTPPAAEMPRAEIRNPGAGRVGAPRCATARLPPSFPAAMGCCMPWFVCVWK